MKEEKKREFYEIKPEKFELLGKGAFSHVYLGKADVYIIENNEKIYTKKDVLIALKEIKGGLDEETLQSITNEISISSKLSDNSNIVKMIDIIEINYNKCIVYEYCNGGDLRQYIDYFGTFDETLIQTIMMQLVNGLIELFEKNVVHHDIKPENILLNLCYDMDDPKKTKKIVKEIKNILKYKKSKFELEQNNNQFPQLLNFQNNMMINNPNNFLMIPNNNAMLNFMNNNNNMNNNFNYNNMMNMNNNVMNMNNMMNMNSNMINMYNVMNMNMNNNMINNNMMNMNNNNAMNVGNMQPQFDVKNNYGLQNNNNFVNSNYNNNINSNNQCPNNSNNYISDSNKIDDSRLNDNNLFTEEKFSKILKESTEFKLSDFGLSKAKSDIKKRNLAGSPLYMSPELFKLDSTLSEIENKKVDIWALGVLTYELFFGKRPFEAFSIDELSKMYDQGTYVINLRVKDKKDQKISKELFFFINRCFQKDPQKRANVYELRNGDFLNYDVISSEKMGENELKKYLKGIVETDNFGNFILNINKDYAEEIKIRELNKMWINNN